MKIALSKDSKKAIAQYAKTSETTPSDAADRLIRSAVLRLAALNKYNHKPRKGKKAKSAKAKSAKAKSAKAKSRAKAKTKPRAKAKPRAKTPRAATRRVKSQAPRELNSASTAEPSPNARPPSTSAKGDALPRSDSGEGVFRWRTG